MRSDVIQVARAACLITLVSTGFLRGANQTEELSPVVIGAPQPFSTQVLPSVAFPSETLPTLHSFAEASFRPANAANAQWLLIGGMTNGLHDMGSGFDPAKRNQTIYVVDPVSQQVWGRSMTDPTSGLTTAQIESLSTTNAQYTQQGSKFYVAGGYGPSTANAGRYHTFSELTAFDLPGLMDWVKTGTGSAAATMRQISDPLFKVTGGEMGTTSNGRTHLVFGQNYPDNYESRQEGVYTKQVRSFTIVDDANGLSVANPVAHAPQESFRRRDLNVVSVIRKVNGQFVDELQALAGVFTPDFGAWTAPVNIDQDGNAVQPDPLAPGTFKQGMNGYRSATVGLYSANEETMHTLLFGGISYLYVDPLTGQVDGDENLPFLNDITDVVTDAQGHITQHLLSAQFPSILASTNGMPLLFGANAEFFLKDGIATYANGVIDLDALTGPTLVGWIYGGIAADAPNGGITIGSNALFPLIITPVPEPSCAMVVALAVALLRRRRPSFASDRATESNQRAFSSLPTFGFRTPFTHWRKYAHRRISNGRRGDHVNAGRRVERGHRPPVRVQRQCQRHCRHG